MDKKLGSPVSKQHVIRRIEGVEVKIHALETLELYGDEW